MFERYTESARRVLFFARYEASEYGGLMVTAEHLLLGLLRGRKGVTDPILRGAKLSYDEVSRELTSRSRGGERVSTSVEIPFNPEVRDILDLTVKEADALNHKDIGSEHLLLGLLRRRETLAFEILDWHGLTLEGTRKQVIDLLSKPGALPIKPSRAVGHA
jgi:ATP-dependent Clp protease ATP-binding subunit ClpC